MSSKITAAIKQLSHSINSLSDAVPAVYDTIKEKESQIAELQTEYLNTHPESISGTWDIDLSSNNDYEHVRLSGWLYDDDYWENEGEDNGNALATAVGKDGDMPLTLQLATSYDKSEYNYAPSATVCFHAGEVTLDFYYFTEVDFFHFIKEHNILIETVSLDKKIEGFKTRMCALEEVRNSIHGAMGTKPEILIDDRSFDIIRDATLCCHPPLWEWDKPLPPVDDFTAPQFNAEAVSTLHKHVGVTYEYLTNIITQLHDNPKDVALVEAMTHGLFNVQSELDNIAVEIGDLDTTDEPTDIGMAGCVYWNLIQAAIYELDGTINYVVEQENPLFAEVRHRLGKLDKMLNNCCKEFEDNWM